MTTIRQDVQEMLDRLKEAGINPGQWHDQPERLVTSGILTGQVGNLQNLKKLLEQLIESDRKRIGVLREQIIRLEHGGGS